MMNYQEDNQDAADSLDFSFSAGFGTYGVLPLAPYSTVSFNYNSGNINHPIHLEPNNESSILQYQDPVHVPTYGPILELTSSAYLPFSQSTSTDLLDVNNNPFESSIMPRHEFVNQYLQPSPARDGTSFLYSSSQPDKRYQQSFCLCVQCNQGFESHSHLNDHAMTTGHGAYQCFGCNKTFSRIDCLQRHSLRHIVELSPKYSCQYCEKWKAPNGFLRKDHLDQHLRIYHHLPTDQKYNTDGWFPDESGFHRYCLQQGCPLFRTEEEGRNMGSYLLFPSRAAFTKHTREVHNTSIYPCTQPSCKKVDGKGFFRKRSLIQHMKKVHKIDISEQAEPNANVEMQDLDDD